VLPVGDWIDLNTGALVTGDGTTSITVPAPLAVLPRWQRAGSFVPLFAIDADTMLPATAPGVTSYTTPAIGRELRLRYAPSGDAATTTLHDGATATGTGATIDVTGGAEYTVFTVDIDARSLAAPFSAPTAVSVDGTDLASVGNVATCAAPGCFDFDNVAKRLQIRVFAAGATKQIAIR
jgi:hypothetical protein